MLKVHQAFCNHRNFKKLMQTSVINFLTLLHSEQPKLHGVLAVLSAKEFEAFLLKFCLYVSFLKNICKFWIRHIVVDYLINEKNLQTNGIFDDICRSRFCLGEWLPYLFGYKTGFSSLE